MQIMLGGSFFMNLPFEFSYIYFSEGKTQFLFRIFILF